MGGILPRHVVDERTVGPLRSFVGPLRSLPARGVERRPLPSGAEVRIIRPRGERRGTRPGLLWMHGGGYVLGFARHDDSFCRRFARGAGCVVASVDYRLAPENPYPAALEDCRAASAVLRSLPGVDADAIAVGGVSAGGGLSAQLSHDLVRRGVEAPALQVLVYPMLDPGTRDAAAEPDGLRVWDARSNRFGWDSYLAGSTGFVPVLDAVGPGLPPTWIGVGTADLFHDECIRYADALRASGVPVESVEVSGGFHGFDVAVPWAPSARMFTRSLIHALRSMRADRPDVCPRGRTD
ncbi:alpha/beta hydrolase [Tsukamurella sp. 1534]|uniref:alpha/beta hydrolase n=1 Tax=Tsukamurella sp. 1534 TaxID=1151061 RepID=UPI001ED9AC69|nr:alpha/beta hydrolase [Tsukamurella sp. 1534]